MKRIIFILSLIFLILVPSKVQCAGSEEEATEKLNVSKIIFEHTGDSYEWHIITIGEKHITIPLPVIIYSKTSGFHVFMSSVFHHTECYEGLSIGKEDGKHAGKIVEVNGSGEEIRPLDLSITKNVIGIFINCIVLLLIILPVSRWYRKHPDGVPKGFIGVIDLLIMSINDDVIKTCVGANYRKFAPYLLTAFYFIFLSNIIGLIPIFPGGANLTGNIAITFTLALLTFLAVNIFGTKEYWKEILWPDVPVWLKAPAPIMPIIEIFGLFTKPFALMIRLFANILAGHAIVIGLCCLIFITAELGTILNGSLTFVSIIFMMFMDCLELLVAYIQAYVFTLLSAVFIGLAQVQPHKSKQKAIN